MSSDFYILANIIQAIMVAKGMSFEQAVQVVDLHNSSLRYYSTCESIQVLDAELERIYNRMVYEAT